MPDYQQSVAQFVADHGLESPIPFRLLDLLSELGEVAKEILKATEYGQQPFTPDDAFTEELADLFFALICIANAADIQLDEALTAALEKYEVRLAQKGHAGSGK